MVFKRDSIWILSESGLNANSEPTYKPTKVVSGTGCVAHSSIQQVRGILIFLDEDGLYSFDGLNVEKLSDRVDGLLGKRSKGKERYVTSVNWAIKSCYLLSYQKDHDSPTHTIVYDYKNDTFWYWDNLRVSHWAIVEGNSEDEKLFYVDNKGKMFEFGTTPLYTNDFIVDYEDADENQIGKQIELSFTTHEIGKATDDAILLRRVAVGSKNRIRSELTANKDGLDVIALPDGVIHEEELDDIGTYPDDPEYDKVSLNYTDSTEADWSDFNWASGTTTDDNWVRHRNRKRLIS